MGLLWRLSRPLLFRLAPETAHGLAIRALKTGLIAGQNIEDRRLRVCLAGLDFPSPLGLAAGFDKNGEVATALFRFGFGHVEIGTVTPRPQAGNPRPRLFRLEQDKSLINRMGFNNKGHAALFQLLCKRKKAGGQGGGITGLNIGANRGSVDRLDDYARAIALFSPFVDYFTLNISSPNTPGLRDLQASEQLEALLTKMQEVQAQLGKDAVFGHVPIFLKIAPDLNENQLDDIAETVSKQVNGRQVCDGLVISNTTLSRPFLASSYAREQGGLSGSALFECSTVILAKMRQRVGSKLPIIGVGGIDDGQTAVEKIRAGADLIQLYSAMIFGGPDIAARILRQMLEICTVDGVSHISQYRDAHVAKWAAMSLKDTLCLS